MGSSAIISCALLLAIAVSVGGHPKDPHSSDLRLNLPSEFGTEIEVQHRPDGAPFIGTGSLIIFFGKMLANMLIGSSKDTTCTVLSFRGLFDIVMELVPDNIITKAVKKTVREEADKCGNKTGLPGNTKLMLLLKMAANGFIFPEPAATMTAGSIAAFSGSTARRLNNTASFTST